MARPDPNMYEVDHKFWDEHCICCLQAVKTVYSCDSCGFKVCPDCTHHKSASFAAPEGTFCCMCAHGSCLERIEHEATKTS